MKKFFEAPAVSSAELTQEDVIMASETKIGESFGADKYVALADTTTYEFEVWKGYTE